MAITAKTPKHNISSTGDGHVIYAAPENEVSGDDVAATEFSISLDSANDALVIRVKYPGGALMCGTVSLSAA